MLLTVPSAAPMLQSQCVNPNQLKTESLENILRLCWRELADQLKLLFPDGDDEGAFIIPALDARSQLLSIQDRRNGVGKPVFKLASLGSGHTFTLVTPELSVPGSSPKVLQRFLSQANKANVCWPPLRLTAFSPPGGSRRLFLRFPVSMGSSLCVDIRLATLLCMIQHLAPGKMLLMNVGAHTVPWPKFI